MKKLLLAIAVILPATAHAEDNSRFLNLGKCMAYATVKGGIDGKKDIPADYLVALKVMLDEYMFEAEALGFSDQQAQDAFVNELMRQNREKKEKGLDTLKKELAETCATLAETLKPKSSPVTHGNAKQ